MSLLSAAPSPVSNTPSSTGPLSRGITIPSTPPAASSSPYFYAKDPDGSTIGSAPESDPYSGTPYFAYRTPGANATTTDYTRVASKFDPRAAAPTPYDEIRNARMPESASQAIRAEEGATSGQQLDHAMALAIGGSNNNKNLRLIPSAQNQGSSGSEGQLQKEVAEGKKSLFEAQTEEAKNKGIPVPFTYIPKNHVNIVDYIKNAFGKLPSELSGIHNPF